jgi:hypothetical protein
LAKIVAVVTTTKDEVAGGAPIFIASDRQHLERTAFLLEKLLDCSAHELYETLFVIVDRHAGNA